MKFVKAAFDTEVIKDTSMSDDLAHANRRYKRIVMTPQEQTLYCESPNAGNHIEHPGYPDKTYGGIE